MKNIVENRVSSRKKEGEILLRNKKLSDTEAKEFINSLIKLYCYELAKYNLEALFGLFNMSERRHKES